MRRRYLIAVIAGMAALPLAAHAQQTASSTAEAASADISMCVPNSAGFPQPLDGPRWNGWGAFTAPVPRGIRNCGVGPSTTPRRSRRF